LHRARRIVAHCGARREQPLNRSAENKGLQPLKYLIIGIGGALGAMARFWLDGLIGQRMGTRFPYGTFFINCSGSFLIGFTLTLLTARAHLNPNWRYLVPIGFIGAYTTFSTFEYETMRSVQDGQLATGALYVTASVVVGFVCVWAGAAAGRALP
jgi:CrcB protein